MNPVEATPDRLTASVDASKQAMVLVRLMHADALQAAVDLLLEMSVNELRECLIAQSCLHIVAVQRAAALMGCTPDEIFAGHGPSLERWVGER